MYFVYLLHCSDDSLYCGITNNLARRVKDHNEGKGRGAKYTAGRRPVTLVYAESMQTKSSALKREYVIKNMSRGEKMKLCEHTQIRL